MVRPVAFVTSLALLSLVACGSNEEDQQAAARETAILQARKAGYDAWNARLAERDAALKKNAEALNAQKAEAEGKDVGPAPDMAALRVPIDNWLAVHRIAAPAANAIEARPEPVVVFFEGRGYEKAWAVDAAIEDRWYTFLVVGDELRGAMWEGLASPREAWSEDGGTLQPGEWRTGPVEAQLKQLRDKPY